MIKQGGGDKAAPVDNKLMETIMLEVSLVLNQNEVEMVCSSLERMVLFEEDGEDTPEFKTNFRLLVRKFAFARSFMKAKMRK